MDTMRHYQKLKFSNGLMVILFIMTGLLLTACGGGVQAKETFTIGAVNYVPVLDQVFEGLKQGMAELGYVEGENITYIYNGVIEPNPEAADREIQSLLAQDVDLIFTMGTLPTHQAKQAVEGTDLPVIFAPVINPLEEGLIKSIRQPGGNVSGVQNGNAIPKALEWLLAAKPGVMKIYTPYHPDDAVSVTAVASVREAALALGVEAEFDEVKTLDEVVTAIESLSGDDTAIFVVPMPSLGGDITGFVGAATERGIVIGSTNGTDVKNGALISYGTNFIAIGKQAARLVDQALRGTPPADLPVETTEFFLNVNLQTAETFAIDIPDEIVRQADVVVR